MMGQPAQLLVMPPRGFWGCKDLSKSTPGSQFASDADLHAVLAQLKVAKAEVDDDVTSCSDQSEHEECCPCAMGFFSSCCGGVYMPTPKIIIEEGGGSWNSICLDRVRSNLKTAHLCDGCCCYVSRELTTAGAKSKNTTQQSKASQ